MSQKEQRKRKNKIGDKEKIIQKMCQENLFRKHLSGRKRKCECCVHKNRRNNYYRKLSRCVSIRNTL